MTTPTTIMSSLIYCVNPHKATTVIPCVNRFCLSLLRSHTLGPLRWLPRLGRGPEGEGEGAAGWWIIIIATTTVNTAIDHRGVLHRCL